MADTFTFVPGGDTTPPQGGQPPVNNGAQPPAQGQPPVNNGAPAQPPVNNGAQPPADDGIPAKFKRADGSVDYAAMAKSYAELEKRMSGAPALQPQQAPAMLPKGPDGQPIQPKPEPLPMDKLFAEYASAGTLRPETRQALVQRGVDPHAVETHLAGQKALMDQHTAKAYEAAGGQQQFEAMKAWASANWTQDQKDGFTAMVNSRNEFTMKAAINQLVNAYKAANGSVENGGLLNGGTPQGGATGGYATITDMTKAISDPRYRSDPQYRAEVERRVLLSNV